ncbi:hypothetical protein B5C34_04635 [Pacificimonas flava]|uniref:diguanylate cyclase n=2 Tax=Pacificimonas TaxID=1960290 RepID=A0A219B4U9_9SPHN|nr:MULTISPECIES: GGDEF domain-containing protein [Pacificimonas]MBZ6377495.1 GGDEF domain-containing protein [Pacificimonas aurantium]OWV32808.1 hypothetical protein B5C34_04635 [Pacificimonas flava]
MNIETSAFFWLLTSLYIVFALAFLLISRVVLLRGPALLAAAAAAMAALGLPIDPFAQLSPGLMYGTAVALHLFGNAALASGLLMRRGRPIPVRMFVLLAGLGTAATFFFTLVVTEVSLRRAGVALAAAAISLITAACLRGDNRTVVDRLILGVVLLSALNYAGRILVVSVPLLGGPLSPAQAQAFLPLHLAGMAVAGTALNILFLSALGIDLIRRQAREIGTDALTGLASRRAFMDRLESLGGRQGRRALPAQPGPVGLILIDIDRFKAVNDRFGHAVGDEVLRRTGAALAGAAPGLPARIGGEEFALLVPAPGPADAARTAEDLRRAVEAALAGGLPDGGDITVSLGWVWSGEPHRETASALLLAADDFLYRAKADGRNRAVGGDMAGMAGASAAGPSRIGNAGAAA